MSKFKQFFIPVSLTERFNAVDYVCGENSDNVFNSHYPAMGLILDNVEQGDNYEIVVLKTVDYDNKPGSNGHKSTNEKSNDNYNILVDELRRNLTDKNVEFSEEKNISVIEISYDENREKHIQLFNNICRKYKKDCEVYVDITYGNKPSSAALLSSLIYAEKVNDCDVCGVSYGEYNHDNGSGKVYDVRCLYELSCLVNTCSQIPGLDINAILGKFGGNE
ncbi:MAG: TM1812 family CRISPR-associated protein [Hominimerdicola sp.]